MLINNAGSSQRALALDTELSVDQRILELNTIGTVSLTKAVLPHMIERGKGCLVVISSVAGLIGKPAYFNFDTGYWCVVLWFDFQALLALRLTP